MDAKTEVVPCPLSRSNYYPPHSCLFIALIKRTFRIRYSKALLYFQLVYALHVLDTVPGQHLHRTIL